ncbi:13006_t:CDS:2 [Cetraspora pellucida]|uniref:13006_t:CDS:1 n=1 Tax=Cetraspora pellucida TaxID=1433469 RepID=A0A9N9IS78_9GLOM|nr:13006_t:CDS:2 [Cetraspora pellucida]
MPKPSYIQAEELRDIIKNKTKIPGKDYLIVDVRDDDYQGGNIPNCINRPSDNFENSLGALISEYSQVRGPSCAMTYANKVNTDQEVHILKSGMEGWTKIYKDDSELLENYEEEGWNY